MKRRARADRSLGAARRRKRPLVVESVESRVLLSTLIVNSTDDDNLRDTKLTLREAILVANGDLLFDDLSDEEQAQITIEPGVDRIHFDLPENGDLTIAPTSALPAVTESVVLDGTSQPGYAGTPVVRLLGTGAGAGADGLRLDAGASTVKGLAIVGFAGAGIAVNSDGNTIQGNHLGIDADGQTVLGNAGGGVVVTSANNQIGGTTAPERNLITGNGSVLQGPTSLSTDAAPRAVGIFQAYTAGGNRSHLVTLGADGHIQTRLGNGDGTFQTPTTVANLPGASLMVVAGADFGDDIDGDYQADLVVANASTGDVYVLLGKGDGTFGVPTRVGNVPTPQALTVIGGDIAVASGDGAGSIQLLINNDDGTFEAPIILSSGKNPVALATATFGFDQDTYDPIRAIVAANRDTDDVTVLERDADGSFKAPITVELAPGSAPTAITAGDLTKNYMDALIVSNPGNNTISILLRGPNGSFGAPRNFEVGSAPSGAAVGDFDGDGQQDIAVANAGDNTVSLILRKPNSQLFLAGSQAVGAGPIAIVAARFSGDWWDPPSDLVTVNGLGGDLSVLLPNTGPADGITLVGPDATDNTIQGNWIGVDGSGNAGPGNIRAGVFVDGASNNLIGGSAPGAGNLISGNLRYGVGVSGGSANTIQGNRIGTNAAGEAALGNYLAGVFINVSGENQILDNLISGNLQHGVHILGALENDADFKTVFIDAPNNVIQGNIIGLNAAGDTKLANGKHGVSTDMATGTIIGGPLASQRNIISGNADHGVDIHSATIYNDDTEEFDYFGAIGTRIQGNYIGTSADGETALGNRGEGVYLVYARQVTIGGAGVGEGNLVSGNGDDGIALRQSDGAVIQGNRIGTNAAGDAALGNGDDSTKIAAGIFLADSANVVVGGSGAGEGNLISGNTGRGILVSRPDTQGASIQGNRIGTDATGALPLPNSLDGITIHNSASNNLIGGAAPGEGNIIAFNLGAGIRIDLGDQPDPADQLPTGNQLLGNLIFQNAEGAIISPSDVATPTPALTSASRINGDVRVIGRVDGPAGATVQVEFFSVGSGAPVFLGSANVTIGANGQGTIDANLAGVSQDVDALVATATSTTPVLNTSEFSAPIQIQTTPPILVDLAIGQTVAPTTGVVGENLVYTITVQNRSTNAATGVIVTSALPASLTFVGSSLTPTSNTGGVARFDLGSLAANESRTFTITARPTATGEVAHVVNVRADQDDSDPANNTSILRTNVEMPVVPPAPVADLQLSLATSPTPIVAGQNATFTYTVTNAGPDAAKNTVFTLALPTGVILISVTPSQGAVEPSGAVPLSTGPLVTANQTSGGPTVTVNLGELAAGASATITVVLEPTEAGNLVGEARVTSDATDPNPGNSVIAPVIVVEPGGPAPTVTSLERIGVHYDPTLLLIGFSQPLDPASAESLNNYVLVDAGRDGRLGTWDDREIPLASATYDTASQTVVLAPRPQLALRGRYGLLVRNGAGGVTGLNGQPLDGNGDGQPGGDFYTVFGSEIWRGGRVSPQPALAARRPMLAPQRRLPMGPRALPVARGPRALPARPALAQRAFLPRGPQALSVRPAFAQRLALMRPLFQRG